MISNLKGEIKLFLPLSALNLSIFTGFYADLSLFGSVAKIF